MSAKVTKRQTLSSVDLSCSSRIDANKHRRPLLRFGRSSTIRLCSLFVILIHLLSGKEHSRTTLYVRIPKYPHPNYLALRRAYANGSFALQSRTSSDVHCIFHSCIFRVPNKIFDFLSRCQETSTTSSTGKQPAVIRAQRQRVTTALTHGQDHDRMMSTRDRATNGEDTASRRRPTML